MASIKDIVQYEGERSEPAHYSIIHMWHEGSFLRAYEWSAWLLCRYVHDFKVTRRQFKGIDAPVTFVGFPKTSLPKFVPDGCTATEPEEKHTEIHLPMSLNEENLSLLKGEYEQWLEKQPLSTTQKKEKKASPVSEGFPATSLTDVMHAILSFPVERKSPIECMLFLAEVKGNLANLI